MTIENSQSLMTALDISRGIVCAVGAGGKKSLLYALAEEASGRIGMTTTVMTLQFPHRFRKNAVVGDDAMLRRTLTQPGTAGVWAYGQPSDKRGRWAGVAADTIAAIHQQGDFDLTLVKADGARMRGIKAPKPGEPVLPETPTLICPIVSARVMGQPLNEETAHRPELLAQVIDAKADALLTADHLARLLTSENGSLHGTDSIRVVPVINQVDDPTLQTLARRAARSALSMTDRYDRVVLARLHDEAPLVETVLCPS